MDSKHEVTVVNIPHSLETGQLQGKWDNGNKIAIFPGPSNFSSSDSSKLNMENNVWEVQFDIEQYKGLARRVISESHDIFLEVQEIANMDSAAKKRSLMKYSKLYRAILRASFIHSNMKDPKIEFHIGNDKKLEELYSVVELVWHLCEIVFVDSPQSYPTPELLEWIVWHFPQADQLHKEMILEAKVFRDHRNYWPTVYGYIVSGRMSSAAELLIATVNDLNDKSDPFLKMSELLRKMPQPNPSPDYILKWRHWQQECRNRLTNDFQQHGQLHKLCRILCGDEKILQQLSAEGIIQTWYHLLVVHVLYRNPTTKVYDLHYSIDLSLELFYGGKLRLGKLDEIISAALQLDTVRVIKEASFGFGDWWFAVHLTDLLYHCGQLKLYKLDYGSDLREYLLLEYGSALMNANLWQIGSDYLGHCQTYGRYYLERYVPRIPVDSEKKMRKVLHICEKYGLSAESLDICREKSMTSIRGGKLGSALSWALYVKDVTLINHVIDCYMSAYIKDGNAERLAIVDDIGTAITLTGQLAFLGKFREFHRLCSAGNLIDAASVLVLLMVDGLASKKYWWMLLLDAIPLFETDEILFDSDQTYELLRCLTEVELSLSGPINNRKSDTKVTLQHERKNSEELYDALNTIQIALARNLARAHINEEQS